VDTITTDLSSLERLKREIRDDILFVPDGANLAATRHMNVEEYYRLLSGRIAYSHIKNFRRTEDGSIEPSSVGDGILDWKPLLTVLCSQRIPTDGFAEQNGRDAERAD
jgi:sugar phosphate isomerase/epimerase